MIETSEEVIRRREKRAKAAANFAKSFWFHRRFGAVEGYTPFESVVWANMGKTSHMLRAADLFRERCGERGVTVEGFGWCDDGYSCAFVVRDHPAGRQGREIDHDGMHDLLADCYIALVADGQSRATTGGGE